MKFKRLREDQQAEGLIWLAEDISSDGIIVEIGSYAGESTVIFSHYFKKVFAIDPWQWNDGNDLWTGFTGDKEKAKEWLPMPCCEEVEKAFDENIEDIHNIVKMKARDIDVLNEFEDGTVDAVYIDSIHTFEEVMITAKRWLPKIRKGGYLCGHDYNEHSWQGVFKAVNELESMLNQKAVIYLDTSWRFNA